MKLLITGGNGQLGRCLQDRLSGCDYEYYAPNKYELDISNEESLRVIITSYLPDIVINAAAYTAVDKAEMESDKAFCINEAAAYILAKCCNEQNIPLIHISTDYVFDGTASEAYSPESEPAPQSVYGKSKLAGEKVIQESLHKHVIIRTSWVFSEHGNNFVKTILRLAKEKDTLNIVADQQGCPTYAGDLAVAILKICEQVRGNLESPWGIYHYCGDIDTNWYEFSKLILKAAGLEKKVMLNPITTDQYPTLAKRPAYSSMNCDSTIRAWNVSLSDWQKSVNHVVGLLSR